MGFQVRLVSRLGLAIAMAAMETALAKAAPITTNTALPVGKGEFVAREQVVVNRSGDDPSGKARKHRVAVSASALGYGVSSDIAIFALLPVVHKRLSLTTSTGGRVVRQAGGAGDARLFARYTIWQRNMPGQTVRLAPFAGVEAPTGAHDRRDGLGRLPASVQPGSGSWDPFGGVIFTWQTRDFELDLQALYQDNTEAAGFAFGDVTRLEASLQVRLWPMALTDATTAYIYGVSELNYISRDRNRVNGVADPNSGGETLWGVLGLQYVTVRSIIEAAVQVPLMQDLNGTALEREVITRASLRVNF